MSIKNKVVIITGASSGIGKATALLIAESGAKVVLAARNQEKLEKAINEIKERNGEAVYKVTDVSKREEVKSLIDFTISKYGKIDVIFNNAGLMPNSPLSEFRTDEWDEMIDVNLKGCFNLIRFVSPYMIRQKSGSIINMTSIVGVSGNAGQVNYAASKAGIIGLTKSVAKEIGSRGITVNAIAPGYIDTEMTQALPEKIRKEWEKQIPMRKFGTVEDIAEACLYLAEQKYMTGQVLQINGGLYM